MTKYIVEQIRQDGYASVFDTLEEANEYALMIWYHLTIKERKNNKIYVDMITEDDLYDTAIDEDTGTIDWLDFSQSHPVEVGFDSDNEISTEWRMAKYIGGKMVDIKFFDEKDTITSFMIERVREMMHDDDDPADTTYVADALTYGGKWIKLEVPQNDLL